MSAELPIQSQSFDAAKAARRVAIGALLVALVYRAGLFAAKGLEAIRFPWELDYGEGIVWQQMRWIFTDKAFGPIDQWPAIVFHYTPLYHAVTSILAGALGTDELATGRAVSLLSTVAAALASAFLVDQLLAGRTTSGMRKVSACVAGLLVFANIPVIQWAPLMRVDMLAMALSLFGLVAAFKSLERPRLIYAASALFVAAVYTKQTSIAAPAAVFAVLLALQPRLALRGIISCTLLGLAVLVALGWTTDGGFYRHIFLYNVNRTEFSRLSAILFAVAMHVILVTLALGAFLLRMLDLRSRYSGKPDARRLLAANAGDVRALIAAAYLLMATLMLVLVAKSGSSINYFLEWFFALGIFAAMAMAEVGRSAAGRVELRNALMVGIPAALALQAWMTPKASLDTDRNGGRARELAGLSQQIAATSKPVISDDMVLLLKSGRDVLWEPAIFAELASTGDWDERPFVNRIRNGEFAFFITWGERGFDRFDERYNPAVADAIEAAYPVTEKRAGLIVHRPRARS